MHDVSLRLPFLQDLQPAEGRRRLHRLGNEAQRHEVVARPDVVASHRDRGDRGAVLRRQERHRAEPLVVIAQLPVGDRVAHLALAHDDAVLRARIDVTVLLAPVEVDHVSFRQPDLVLILLVRDEVVGVVVLGGDEAAATDVALSRQRHDLRDGARPVRLRRRSLRGHRRGSLGLWSRRLRRQRLLGRLLLRLGGRRSRLSLRDDLAHGRRSRRHQERIAGVDPVRIEDVAIFVPDLRPEVRVAEGQVRQIPERVAGDDDVQRRLGRKRLGLGRIVRRPVIADQFQVLGRSGRSGLQRPADPLLPGRLPLLLDRGGVGRLRRLGLRGLLGRRPLGPALLGSPRLFRREACRDQQARPKEEDRGRGQ